MDPLLLDVPDAFETERLIVRCPRPGDGRLVYEALVESLDDPDGTLRDTCLYSRVSG